MVANILRYNIVRAKLLCNAMPWRNIITSNFSVSLIFVLSMLLNC